MKFGWYALLLVCSTALAQSDDAADPLFASNNILQVTIEAPLDTLIRKKSKEDYLHGLFRYTDEDGVEREFTLRLRARGNFRHENCDYPPVRLNFIKSETKDTLFDKQDKLKLVVHCDRSAKYQQIVLQEYLTYRILNSLTDQSMRVRLLQVIYVDTDKQRVSDPRYAFLIEHQNRAAKRLGLEELETARTTIARILPEQLNLTSVFQYFIGNTDFSPIAGAPGNECCHNYILFQDEDRLVTAIPYDFDQSGFVDAPYANASPQFRLRSVRQRLYRGRCVNNEYVAGSIEKFKEKRDTIYGLVAEQEGFSPRTKKDLVGFIDDFYELIDDAKDVEKKILKKCI